MTTANEQNQTPAQTPAGKAMEILRTAPWAAVISDEQRGQWIESTIGAVGPEELIWHAYRATGLGGSDIGAIMAELNGEHAFSSIQEILESKFLLTHPTPSKGHTARGHYFEPWMEQHAPAALGATRDVEAFDAVNAFTPDADRPYQRINLDDIFMVTKEGQLTKRILVDYKSPMNVAAFMRSDAPMAYRAQLHYYKAAADKLGIQIDSMCLAVPDIAEMVPRFMDIEIDDQLTKDIFDVADHIYNEFLMKGMIPEEEEKADNLREPSKKMTALTEEYISAHAIAAMANERVEELKTDIKARALLEGIRGGEKMAAQFVGVTAKDVNSPDIKSIKTALKAADLDVDDYCVEVTSKEFNPKAALKALRDLQIAGELDEKIDLDAMSSAPMSLTVNAQRAGKKNFEARSAANMRDYASQIVEAQSRVILNALREDIANHEKESNADEAAPAVASGMTK